MLRIVSFFKKMKNKLLLNLYCEKVDYTKMRAIDYVIAYSLSFLQFAFYLFVYLGSPILYIVYYSVINKFLNEFFQSHSNNYINELAITMYGLQLTIFSIMIALKHKKIYGIINNLLILIMFN